MSNCTGPGLIANDLRFSSKDLLIYFEPNVFY